MTALISSCIGVIRTLPQGTALEVPWSWLQQHELAEGSIIYPTIDFSNEHKVRQTAARLFFAIIWPFLAKPFGYANTGIGIAHFVWCICNVNKIRKREDGYSGQEMENALVRILTGVYDLAVAYILCSSLMSSLYGQSTIPLLFALLPSYPLQLHHLIFEHATKTIPSDDKKAPPKIEVDYYNLKVGCLIKQFCSGLVLTFFPEPKAAATLKDRLLTFPAAIWGFGTATASKIWTNGAAAQPPAGSKA